jgi:internalin A
MGICVNTSDDAQTVERSSDLLAYLTDLSNLRILDLSNYHSPKTPAPFIGRVIEHLGHFKDLIELTVSGFLLYEVPPTIRRLEELQFLFILRAALNSVPDWVGDLKALRWLLLSGNTLKTLPESLANLQLQDLHIPTNVFDQVPDVVFRMTSLVKLFVSANRGIREIPPQILDLPNLEILDAQNCPIEIPPPEIVGKGVEAVKEYWRQHQEQGTDYLCEAKLFSSSARPAPEKPHLSKKSRIPPTS